MTTTVIVQPHGHQVEATITESGVATTHRLPSDGETRITVFGDREVTIRETDTPAAEAIGRYMKDAARGRS